MLLLYTGTAGVTDQKLALCEQALSSGLPSAEQERELRIFNILEARVLSVRLEEMLSKAPYLRELGRWLEQTLSAV
ncbi:UNVERIFIED_CONTAM: hypothetical protein ABIC26_000245 [Paenibacillus sp. PvR008]